MRDYIAGWYRETGEERKRQTKLNEKADVLKNGAKSNNPVEDDALRKAEKTAEFIDKCTVPKDIQAQRGSNWTGYATLKKLLKIKKGETMDEMVKRFNAESVGKEITEKGFLSCGVADGSGFMSKDIIFHILIPAGSKAAYVEPFAAHGAGQRRAWNGKEKQKSFSAQQEILIQRGSTLRFRSFRKDLTTGKLIIECELIQK